MFPPPWQYSISDPTLSLGRKKNNLINFKFYKQTTQHSTRRKISSVEKMNFIPPEKKKRPFWLSSENVRTFPFLNWDPGVVVRSTKWTLGWAGKASSACVGQPYPTFTTITQITFSRILLAQDSSSTSPVNHIFTFPWYSTFYFAFTRLLGICSRLVWVLISIHNPHWNYLKNMYPSQRHLSVACI